MQEARRNREHEVFERCRIRRTRQKKSYGKTLPNSSEQDIGDDNGYGNVSGESDGSTGTDENDCYLLFDIEQTDSDGDSLTYWEELNIYETDPTVRNDRYAILLCTDESWPDADDAEQLVKEVYHFDDDNIWKYEGADATSVNFQDAINQVSDLADDSDFVYIGIGSHGFIGGMVFSDGNENYDIIDGWLDTINCMRMIISLDNCHSGSAIRADDTQPICTGDLCTSPCPRVIYTACDVLETSTGNFHVHFYEALGLDATAYQNADTNFGNNDGVVSIREAFLYAQQHTLDDIGRHALESSDDDIWDSTIFGYR